jgi:hypothetical protein
MTVSIDVTATVRDFAATLDQFHQRQLPFAVKNALNQTADAAQIAVRQSLPLHFDVTRPDFLNLLVKINNEDRATKDKPDVTIRIAPPRSGKTASDILSKFEDGGEQVSIAGHQYIPYPSKDIRTGKRGTKVKRGMKFSQFRGFGEATLLNVLQHRGGLNGSKRATTRGPSKPRLVGQKGSFLITLTKGKSAGRPMLLRRTGPGKKDIEGLYVFVPHVHIPYLLHFQETVRAVTPRLFEYFFANEMRRAMETAR